ncbi:MAG: ABC transporter permease [Lachnospiraceae bacterium]|jgi:putative ABC transport system permease protein|nr:ABC transporter permease [Lachnospiraceae bacterium]MCI9099400.1 ABC transporter permease [Lachnospiraceae bacterium]MCI9358396.1 ABC transporter permease [Lachnospiraceae bacterium]
MLENIRLAFQGIWSHKMRSFLTMLGIIIGIASIISIVSTIKGTSEQIKEQLIGAGNNAVDVLLYDGSAEYDASWGMTTAALPQITEEQKDKILRLDNVENATFFYGRGYSENIYYMDQSMQGGKVYGVDENYLDTCGYVIQAGRGFVRADYENYRKVVLLDEEAAGSLFKDEMPLGKTIEIMGEPFVVVGIYTRAETFQPIINNYEEYYSYYGDAGAGTLLLPSSDWPIIYKYDEAENAIVKASSTEAMTKVGDRAAKILNEAIPEESTQIKYKANNNLKTVEDQQKLSESTNGQLLWIASISLLVGGIGVMNIMLVSVTERTSEIGLKKAIGARKNRILFQFLTEAAVLTSLGGVAGVVSGIVMANVISRMADIPIAISIPAIIASVGFSMVIGIVFGLLPSFKAANLNPIDALRRD